MADRGQVITFYSYKGGVGRSFLLTSIAVTLARWGRRVLCIDWDLEAPGLELYFASYISERRKGLLDLVEAFQNEDSESSWNDYVSSVTLPEGFVLDFIAAGDGNDYAARVQAIDWEALFEEHNFAVKLERIRCEFKHKYDYILVDSRTGFSDTGGICAVQLPDVLVMLVTTNMQSIKGTLEIASRIPAARDSLSFDRLALPIIPVLSRFDAREERALGTEWQSRAADRLGGLYEAWLPRGLGALDVMERTTIPYVPSWNFGEQIPVLEERSTSPESITWAIENVAALIGVGVADVASLVSDRDAFVRGARAQAIHPPLTYDLFISGDMDDAIRARELHMALSSDQLLIANPDDDQVGTNWSDELEASVGASAHLVLLVAGELSKRQEAELKLFLGEMVRRDLNSRIVVVRTRREPLRLPKSLNYEAVIEWTNPMRVAMEVERALALRGHDAIEQWQALTAERDRILGPEHATTINSRVNLAFAYEAEGDFAGAIPLLEQGLADRERLLGRENPDTSAVRARLADAYEATGQISRAIPLLEQIVEQRERRLGPEHEATLAVRNKLAVAYRRAGRMVQVISLLEHSVIELGRLIERGDPDALGVRNNLALAYQAVGRLSDAVPLLERGVVDSERVFGADHPNTLTSRNNLALACRAVGRLEDAINLHETTLAGRSRVLGRYHPDTLASGNNLAEAYRAIGRFEDAIVLHQSNLDAAVRSLPPDHPLILTERKNLALLLADVGRDWDALAVTEDAVSTYRELAATRRDAYLPDLAATLSILANRLVDVGRRREALDVMDEAAAIYHELIVSRPNASGYEPALVDLSHRRDELLGALRPTDHLRVGQSEDAELSDRLGSGLYQNWREFRFILETETVDERDTHGNPRRSAPENMGDASLVALNDDFLRDVGLEQLSGRMKRLMLEFVYKTLERRVGSRISHRMSPGQIDEFERAARDDKGAFLWLTANIPEYKSIVASEYSKLQDELRSVADYLLRDAGRETATET